MLEDMLQFRTTEEVAVKSPKARTNSPKPAKLPRTKSESWLEEVVVLLVDDLTEVPKVRSSDDSSESPTLESSLLRSRNRHGLAGRLSGLIPRDQQRKSCQLLKSLLALSFVSLLAGLVAPQLSLWSTRAQVWGLTASASPTASSAVAHMLGLLLPQMMPVVAMFGLMGFLLSRSADSLGRSDRDFIHKVLKLCWRAPVQGSQPWHLESSMGAVVAAGEEIFFRLLLSHAVMASVQLLRSTEHLLGSSIGYCIMFAGAVITIKEVALGDVQPGGQSDDIRVLKRVGTGLLMAAVGIFQVHSFHINGASSDSYWHFLHTDEAQRRFAGHHSMRDATTGVQILIVNATAGFPHHHHEIDAWVHQYGSNGLVFFIAELVLALCDAVSCVGGFDTSGQQRHAFVQGALLANLMYAVYKASAGCTQRFTPGLAHVVHWFRGVVLVHCMTTHGLFFTVLLHMLSEVLYVTWACFTMRCVVPALVVRGFPLFEWQKETSGTESKSDTSSTEKLRISG